MSMTERTGLESSRDERGSATVRMLRAAGGRGLTVALYAGLIGWGFIMLYPLVFMLFGSLKTTQEIAGNLFAPPSWPPKFENWVEVWRGGPTGIPIGRYFLNSLIITGGTLTVLMVSGTLSGYALARFPFPGNALVHRFFLAALAIPVHATMVPVFVFLRTLNLTNNYIGLIGVYSAFWLPFTTIMLRAYFESFPRELEDAARIDGCSAFGAFWRVVFPMSRGAMASIAIINVVGIWSELLFAIIIMNSSDMKTLTVGILSIRGEYVTYWNLIYAGLAIATLPTLIFFILLQRQITKGMTLGAFR